MPHFDVHLSADGMVLEAMIGLNVPLPFDALIGLDVLRECLLILDGPGQQFMLGF